MSKDITIRMREIGGDATLAGATNGARSLGKMIAALSKATDVAVVFLDFTGVDVATASFLRESALGLRDYCRTSRPNLYPVICNSNSDVLEELKELLSLLGDALVICEVKSGTVESASVLGRLDEKQELTLQAVLRVKRADAVTLARQHPKDGAGPTAWNNRLAALLAKGILKEALVGRTKVYEPVLEVLSHGN